MSWVCVHSQTCLTGCQLPEPEVHLLWHKVEIVDQYEVGSVQTVKNVTRVSLYTGMHT